MTPHSDNARTDSVTTLMLETFRLNGQLIGAGDRLVASLGLTSARWQVLGAVALAGEPQTVADIARRMGLARQSVQRTVDALRDEGLVTLVDNPRHRRAKRVQLTRAGEDRYAQAMARHAPWTAGLAEAVEPRALAAAIEVMQTLRARLEAEAPSSPLD